MESELILVNGLQREMALLQQLVLVQLCKDPVEDSSKPYGRLRQQLLHDPLFLDYACVFGGIQFQIGRFPGFPDERIIIFVVTTSLVVVGIDVESERGGVEVEFFGKDDLAVELVDRFSPREWAEGIVVDAQTALALVLALAKGKERQDGLPHGCRCGASGRTRGRAGEPRLEFVFPFPEEAFPDKTTDIRIVDGISEVSFNVWEGKRVGIVSGEGAEAFGDEEGVPYGVEVW